MLASLPEVTSSSSNARVWSILPRKNWSHAPACFVCDRCSDTGTYCTSTDRSRKSQRQTMFKWNDDDPLIPLLSTNSPPNSRSITMNRNGCATSTGITQRQRQRQQKPTDTEQSLVESPKPRIKGKKSGKMGFLRKIGLHASLRKQKRIHSGGKFKNATSDSGSLSKTYTAGRTHSMDGSLGSVFRSYHHHHARANTSKNKSNNVKASSGEVNQPTVNQRFTFRKLGHTGSLDASFEETAEGMVAITTDLSRIKRPPEVIKIHPPQRNDMISDMISPLSVPDTNPCHASFDLASHYLEQIQNYKQLSLSEFASNLSTVETQKTIQATDTTTATKRKQTRHHCQSLYFTDDRFRTLLLGGIVAVGSSATTICLEVVALVFDTGRMVPPLGHSLLPLVCITLASLLTLGTGLWMVIHQRCALIDKANLKQSMDVLYEERDSLESSNTRLRCQKMVESIAKDQLEQRVRAKSNYCAPMTTWSDAPPELVIEVIRERQCRLQEIEDHLKNQVLVLVTKALMLSNRPKRPKQQEHPQPQKANAASPVLNGIGINFMCTRIRQIRGVTVDKQSLLDLIKTRGPEKAVLDVFRALLIADNAIDDGSTNSNGILPTKDPPIKIFYFDPLAATGR